MTRLVDLDPAWLLDGGRVVGFIFQCPCCKTFSVRCLFANPPDAGPPLRQDSRNPADHSGLRYRRSGET